MPQSGEIGRFCRTIRIAYQPRTSERRQPPALNTVQADRQLVLRQAAQPRGGLQVTCTSTPKKCIMRARGRPVRISVSGTPKYSSSGRPTAPITDSQGGVICPRWSLRLHRRGEKWRDSRLRSWRESVTSRFSSPCWTMRNRKWIHIAADRPKPCRARLRTALPAKRQSVDEELPEADPRGHHCRNSTKWNNIGGITPCAVPLDALTRKVEVLTIADQSEARDGPGRRAALPK